MRLLPIRLALALLLVGRVAAAAAPAEEFSVDAPPSWTDSLALPAPGKVPAGDSYEVLIRDDQILIGRGPLQHFRRRAWRIADASGVQTFSHLQFDFDPAYERLHLHGVWIVRDGQRRQVVRKDSVKVIQRESSLSDDVYTGTRSAVVFLEDVRVGDIVEEAWTIEGSNPVFAGHVWIATDLGGPMPFRKVRTRVLASADRKLAVRVSSGGVPVIRGSGPLTEYVYEAADTPRTQFEDRVPGDVEEHPFLEATDCHSWAEVAQWATATFDVGGGPSPRLDGEVTRIRSAHPTDEARFLEALRFVQDDVRYVGIELGENSHRPHSPEDVLRNRYGDCKDKALLLTRLLRALGFDAWPAIVNTELRRGLDARLPSAGLFDHVIVKARIRGRVVWVDATATLQRGPLDVRMPPPFERALVVDSATTALETIPAPAWNGRLVTVEEHYQVDTTFGPAILTVESRYVGPEADEHRRSFGGIQRDDLEREFLNFYARTFPKIALEKPLEIVDDPVANVLLVRETYRIPAFWNDAETDKHFYPESLDEALKAPEITRRARPIQLTFPLHVLHRVVVEMPEKLDAPNESRVIEGPGIRFHRTERNADHRLQLDYELEHTASRVEVAEVPRYVETLRSIVDELGYGISKPTAEVLQRDRDSEFWTGVVMLGFLAGLGVLFMLWRVYGERITRRFSRAERRRRAFVRKFGESAGESPSAARTFDSLEAARAHLDGLRCRCGAMNLPKRESEIVLGGKRLSACAWTCPSCGQEGHFYFSVAELAQTG